MVSSPEIRQGVLPAGFLKEREVEPVGRWFLNQWDRINSNRTISHGVLSESSGSESEEEDDEEMFEDDLEYLRSLDPKETQEQDHYKVLGISKLRILATDDQIKKAHRHKVLRHHPDKRKAAGEEIKEDDDYFSCITKAFEILGNPATRRAFDSVDPTFDDDVPEVLKKDSKVDFAMKFGPVFEANTRWSVKTPVPQLGTMKSSREDVDTFYSFWFDFDSWREYSYLDEEDKEKAGDKWERREIDKINKAQRKEKKADETKRVRKLVDNAYNSDPRIAKFREEEKNEKLAKKKAKADQAKARRDEEERKVREQEEAERKEKEAKEEVEKAKKAVEKKEKDEMKRLLKIERKKLRTFAKDLNYFVIDEDEKLTHLAEVEKMCELYNIEQLKDLVERLEKDKSKAREVFVKEMNKLNNKMEEDRIEEAQMTGKTSEGGKSKTGAEWDTEELQLMIKSVNAFPAGTVNRWEVCAEFINQHSNFPPRHAKEVLFKAKEMQSGNFAMTSLKDEVNKMAYENLQKGQDRKVLERAARESEASQRTETTSEMMGTAPWTPEEQKLLEQALKTFPSSTPERWDRISEAVSGRSKKDCMKRYKELAELIKAKKAAMAAAKKS
eukprot:GFUD01001316.1.p1 GENE.GFUD01001316.1~~GFUD01001316.1.p1  ORF type:complete len:613 (+),score=231.39 GFUD01001316.1:42-1880(+)